MQSEKIDLLADALLKAQNEMEGVEKDSKNVIFGSKYVTLSEVQRVIKAPLFKHGLVITQGGSNGFIFTQLTHTSGQWMRSELPLPPSIVDPQKIGSAITYFRRYGLAAMLNIAQEDDDANAATDPKKNGQSETANSTLKAGKDRASIILTYNQASILSDKEVDAALTKHKASKLSELPQNVADDLIAIGKKREQELEA